MIEIVFVFW